MNGSNQDSDGAVMQLCPACGLCCDGVLFADVKLQRGDDPERLAGLGLKLRGNGRMKQFRQPCSCFDGCHCRIYADRPVRCRTFECRLLQRVQAGQAEVKSALRRIASARRQADAIRVLLRRLGQNDEALPLSRRYAKLMAEPIDLSRGEEASALRGELMRAMHRFMETLHRDFLT